MSEKPDKSRSWKKINLGSDRLKVFFIKHLDRIYGAKLHLVSKLPSLASEVEFADLKNAINETVEDV
jgi:ferritin-like metal-binding protein YciE